MTALRALLALIALSAAAPGLWATISPSGFFTDFPGIGAWVAELPPFNEHLTRDVGAFYSAFAVLFAWAAWRPSRALVVPLAISWSLFSFLHLAFHAVNLDGYSADDAVGQTVSLVAVLATGAALIVMTPRSEGDRRAST